MQSSDPVFEPYTTLVQNFVGPNEHRLAALGHAAHLIDRGALSTGGSYTAETVVDVAQIFADFLDADDTPAEDDKAA